MSYALYNNQMEHLAEDQSDQDLEAEPIGFEMSSPESVQACRAVRHGMIAMAVFAFVGIACLHFSSKASNSSLDDVQVKAGLYSNGAFNQLPQVAATPAATPVAAVVTAAPAAPVAPVEPAATEEQHTVLNQDINSVNDLTGGRKGVKVSAASSNPMAPDENLANGNVCCDDEEKFEGLCYKKCSILTNGEYDTRLSGFQCGKGAGFSDFFKSMSKGFPIPCTGFDVAGDECGKGCPHQKGACLVTEELYLGKCYKKCSDLTAKGFPYRTSPATCCKDENFLECISPTESKFSPDFSVGGGVTSKDQVVHSPEVELTEATR